MDRVVIGLGFGDEGKGVTTDFLCSQNPEALVIRFSGGHQCGHTVVKNEIRHVFSNFGSGTLSGCHTYWSKYCTIEPIGLIRELNDLKRFIDPIIYIDSKCPITTPYDIKANQLDQSNLEHGSCGVGFGATIEREEYYYSLSFLDIYYPDILKMRLKAISDYYDLSELDIDIFLNACKELRKSGNIILVHEKPAGYEDCIYEGSQGLLLDQHYGLFPNVTRSNTGTTNLPGGTFEYFLVTRAYQTRHGNGFMTNREKVFPLQIDERETNTTHEYQGAFKKSMLDVSLLNYGIEKDNKLRRSLTKNLVITCVDHILERKFTWNNEVHSFDTTDGFLRAIGDLLNIGSIYYNCDPDSKYFEKL